MDKFRNRYRIPSARATWWNYGWAGAYFITICTQNREHHFGEIVNGEMRLSQTGVIADILWHEIPNHDPNVELGAFVVMPNHIHGILILNQDADKVESRPSFSPISTEAALKNEQMSKISPKSHTVPAVLRSYKSAVTKHANRLGLPNGWQARFHDHIIRNDAEYQRINDYIETNPQNWGKDKFYRQ